jgi:microcystin-dependent protein
VPSGWLVCDGRAVSRTTYAALFTAIGTLWGGGDGSTTFNLPPLTNRFRRQTGDLAGPVGNTQASCNLAHTHPVVGTSSGQNQNHVHDISHTTGTDFPDHTHNVPQAVTGQQKPQSGGTAPFDSNITVQSSGATARHQHSFAGNSGAANVDHNHTVNFNSGGGSADNAQEARPYSATVLTCIKT